ncbi:U3 snoRNP protein [Ophidiomyces ophidiicola]|nr:U3 snoRNP protein [Ophidiomyces ophidiicola]KAI1991186.1 U3 snoRNP protein [Ophidiomyces ophidiicola]KAI1994112.1 U3 snoRNP protein [Ophidiomyces ophidiicola]
MEKNYAAWKARAFSQFSASFALEGYLAEASPFYQLPMASKTAQRTRTAVTSYESERSELSGEEMPSKDETEEQLEKLLFGDSWGFHDAISGHKATSTDLVLQETPESGEEDEEIADNDSIDYFAGLDDSDDTIFPRPRLLSYTDNTVQLFILDTGNGEVLPNAQAPLKLEKRLAIDASLSDTESAPAAWEDSDDERITVSLATNQRMRKLRVAESEDLVTGKEYSRRLRKQFVQLQPMPEWAHPQTTRAAKRRKTGRNDTSLFADESGASGDEIDSDTEDSLSQQPLARLLQNIGSLTSKGGQDKPKGTVKFRQGVLDIQRLKDVGGNQPSTIESLNFHPHYPLLLSSGPASTLFLHHVSPQSLSPNPLLTSLHIRRTPLRTSAFLAPSGNRIFFSGRRRYFHIWDLDTGKVEKVNGSADRKEEQKSMERFKLSPCGRWMGLVGTTRKGGGIITVLDAKTIQWVSQVRVDSRGGVADFEWWSDGEGMCVVGKNGEVSEWDGREKRIIARWVDEGAVGTTAIKLGGKSGKPQLGGDRWVAIGSSSGIVNIYDRRPWAGATASIPQTAMKSIKGEPDNMQFGIPKNPKPTRMLDQLTTPVSHLAFSNNGQLLVMASRWKKDALKLVHLPSCTVYKNWPTSNTPFGRISAVAVSPMSDMLAVANEQGKIRLWEIHG